MRKYKTIMELIFIFLIPLILILSGLNLKENQITTSTGYEWNTYIEYNNKILIEMGEYKNVIQNFNIWDEQWQIGAISGTTGQYTTNGNRLVTKNYIQVIANEDYYIKLPQNINLFTRYYDENRNYIGYGLTMPYYGSNILNIPNNVYYLKFQLDGEYGTTYKNDICINKSITWANGNYVPYGKPLIIYSNEDISEQNNRTYTPFGEIKNLILNNLKIQQNTITNILFDYTILWFLMFILWHVLYLFFDMLIHLFIDWGHREKEKING